MNKITYIKFVFVVFCLLFGINGATQTYKTFSIRKNIDVNGSMLLVGNNILGQDNSPFNDNTKDNQDISMQYIDIDLDNSTFSSSSAELLMPTQPDGSPTTCYRVAYAGLYWGAVLQSGSRTDINKVKFKLPRSTIYEDIDGEVIYDAIVSPIAAGNNEPLNTPYTCYADVTNLLSGLSNDIEGDYTLANVVSSEGFNNSTGLSAGWTLIVIFENPNLNMKSFTTFDGFSHVYDSHKEDVTITGFTTPQAGTINLQYAYAALDGDKTKRATKFELNGKEINTPLRPANKFFGSVIENTNGVSNPRNPSGTNTLGYDTGFLEVQNAEPEYIKNNDSSATLTLQVARGQADPVFLFFNAFAVDIIAPDINLTKIVVDASGDDIDGQDVTLGQNLFYEITYQSVGSDNVTQFTLNDVLPDNVFFDPSTGIDLSNAGGATLQSYDVATRTLIFDIPDGSVQINDPQFVIRLAVQVVSNCYDLSQACSNEIRNQAFATYRGVINTNVIQDEGSFASVQCLSTPAPTNFLVDISNCTFERDEVLCGSSVILMASDGYDSYSWSTNLSGTPVISTEQIYTATETGTYYVRNTTSTTCISINETINVIPYGNTITNPIIPFADLLPICPNDGKVLPNIFLCGANDTREISTGISDAVSIIWEKLDESSCTAIKIDDCANENSACTWNQVDTGSNYKANTSGQFRIVINYPGGCFSVFYFDVYQNLLNPTVTANDIICTTSGGITVGGVPSGYEYSIDGTNYQASNNFTVTSQGYYIIYIRQIGVDTNPCIFETPSVYVRDRDFSVTSIISQPYCYSDKGSIKLAVNDALPQYYYNIYLGATLVSSVGPTIQSDFTFANLNAGTYTINVSTDDGCTFTDDIDIIEPAVLTATSALTKPLTCTDGEITVYPVGGTPPYLYYVNSTTDFQNTSLISTSISGVYNITVVDSNNCSVQTSIAVNQIAKPVFDVDETDVLCYGDSSGQIQFNVTNANGYAVEYSIDNGVTYLTNPIFSNLNTGDYQASIKYVLNGTECFSTPQNFTINQPNIALSASAGVSELAGCGPSREGRVRITNPQGGVAPYGYSFDNQGSWVSSNEAYLAPGTYTLYIRDANGCIFQMTNVTIDPEPVAPTIDVSDPDFNCDGSANSTVAVINPGTNAYAYTYLLDGVENTNTADPSTFLNVSDGPHTVSVTYQLQTVPTFSNLLNETFGYGEDTASPGMNPVYYCFERQVAATQCKNNIRIQDGDYSVTADIVRPYGAWVNPVDHTPATSPSTPKGRFLVVNIGASIPAAEILYEKFIDDIIPNQPINVEFFAMNLLRSGNTQPNPDLRVALVDGSGIEVSSFSTGSIPKTETWENYPKTPITLNPGANTSLRFIVRSNVQLTSGNDVAIDDITIYQLPRTCVTQKDFPIVIGSGNAFDASIVNATDVTCFDANDGTITISAQNFDPVNGFQYSLDGATWITEMTSPYTITGLADGSYSVQIRYDGIAAGCDYSFNQSITAPAPLSISASATSITCLDGAVVTATASGGTLAYSFELLDTSLNLISNFPGSGVLTNVPAGDYIIRVIDANSCSETTTINLLDPTPPTATIINADYCYDVTNGASFEVSASGGQAPYEYTINGSAFQTNPVFGNLTPGTYDIIVRDAYGCLFSIPTETIAPQVNLSAVLTKELDCTIATDAVITGTIADGYPNSSSNYQYEVSINGGAFNSLGAIGTSFTYTATADGTYQFQVTDDNGCEVLSNTITVNPIELPTASTTSVNPSCNGDANGSVQIVPADGVGPYEFSFNGSVFTTTSLYTGLSAGINYAYEVRDSKNCVVTSSITLIEPTVLLASASATTFSCDAANGSQSALVTIDLPTTGTAPYTYSFAGSGYSSNNTLTLNENGTDQTINYSVKDAQGCTAGGTLTILQLNPPSDLDFIASDITCINTTSAVNVTATNGLGALEFETIAPSPVIFAKQTSNSFTGLTPGTYVFRVTDASGCYYTESYTIDPVTEIVTTGLVANNVSCNGGADAAIGFRVDRFSTTYSYSFNGAAVVSGQTNPRLLFTGLSAGVQTITITDDATGCIDTKTVTVSEPTNALSITSAIATHVHCNEYNSQITVSASDGTPSYTFTAVISGNPAPASGDYNSSPIVNVDTNSGADLAWDVYVKDANGCTDFITETVILDAAPTVTTPALASNQCTEASGFTFTAAGADGVPPYQYSINGGTSYQASPSFIVNTPGSYTVTIRDANGCTATSAAPTVVYAPLTSLAAITKELDCSASPDAVITVTISGGSTAFTYTVQKGAGVTSAASAPITGPAFTYSVSLANVDRYTFEITDANGCTSTSIITIDPITTPLATPTITDVSCNGASDGSIQLVGSEGSGGYTYSDDNITYTGTSLFTGLSAGSYTFYIQDSKNCTSPVSVTIAEPTALVATASATGFSCSVANTNQSADITIAVPTTGTAPYQYSFDGGANFSTSNTLTVNDNGLDQTFSYVVRDANGCLTLAQNITLNRLNPPTDLGIASTPITCSATTSTVTLTATNGVGSFEYETMAPSPIILAKQTSNVFTGLTPGTYVFRVTDASGCYYTESYTIDPVIEIVTTGLVANNVSCNGGTDAAIGFRVDRFSTTYSYSFNGAAVVSGQTNPRLLFTGLSAGVQTITVTDDATGCIDTKTVTVSEPTNALSITSAIATHVHCNEYNSQITVSASDGTPSYTYAAIISGNPAPVSGDYNSSNVINVDTNTGTDLVWDIYVKDANDCTDFTTVNIILDAVPVVTVPNLASNQCSAPSGFTFTATGTGIAPLSYSINGGVSYQTSPLFTVNTPGFYTITIRDGNGCTATSANTVDVYAPMTTSATLTKDITCVLGSEAASVDITVAGGNGTYTYEVSTDGGTTYASITGSPYTTTTAGNYIFRITDDNSCTHETNVVTVSTPVSPEVTVSPTLLQSILCNGEETATIDVTIDNTKGLAPFVINVYNDTESRNYGTQTSGLEAGDYTVTVTDANGCIDIDTITITEPSPIVINHHADPITCIGVGITKGAVVVDNVTGGTGPYNYFVTGNNGYTGTELNNTGTTSTTFDIVDFGIYQINIVDANGCSVLIEDVKVAAPPDQLDISVNITADCTLGGTAEVIVGTALTGNGPFHFAIYSGPGMTYSAPTNVPWQDEDALGSKRTTFTNLIPDVKYTFIVYDEDTMCYYYQEADTPVPTNSSLTIDAFIADNITCSGSADGIVSFDIVSTYSVDTDVSYEILDAQTLIPISPTPVTGTAIVPANSTLNVTNLGLLDFGNYVVVIEETTGPNAGCGVTTLPFNITESAIDLTISASSTRNQNCNELGVISAVATDGAAPYEYQFLLESTTAPIATDSGWVTSNTFEGAEEDYTVYVKDAYGCIKEADVTINLDALPTIIPVTQQCFNGTAISITLVEGTGTAVAPLTYSIGGAYQSSDTFTISSAGPYTLSIRDGNGCLASTTLDIQTPLLLDANLTQDLTCAVDASVTLSASGGTGTYTTYEVSFNGGLYAPASAVFSTTTSGIYKFKVIDSQTCEAESAEIIVTPNTTPTPAETHVDVTCNGGANGSIVVTAADGIAPYEYSNDNGVTFQSSNIFGGLIQGTYNIVVRDSKSCVSLAVPVTVDEPLLVDGTGILTQGLLCGAGNATQPAIVTINGSGGTGSYTYSFDAGVNYTTTNTFTTYTPGTVSAYVKDANGCIIALPIDVIVPTLNAPTDLDFIATAITCAALTSDVTLTTTDGISPLTYEIIAPASAIGNTSGDASGIYTNLLPDTYIFRVTDANGCTYTESYTVIPVTNITVSGLLVSDVSCNAGTNGSVEFTVGDFASTYSYTINGTPTGTSVSALTIPLTGLTVGNQTIIVTDDITDCTATFTVNISEPTALSLVETININATCNFDTQVTVEARGGTPNYEYAFVQDGVAPLSSDYTLSASAVLDPATNTDWDVWVRDANGCLESIDVVIDTDPLPTIVSLTQQCFTGSPITITLVQGEVGAIAPFTYSIGTGGIAGAYQANDTFTINAAGAYDLFITDGNGCIATTTYVVESPLLLDADLIQDLTCVDDARITLSASGGTGTYTTYEVSFNGAPYTPASAIYTTNTNGTYQFRVIDSQTCEAESAEIIVTPNTTPTLTETHTDAKCNGDSEGSIVVTGGSGIAPYEYSINGGFFQTSNVFTSLSSGTYNMVVRDSKRCESLPVAVTIDDPAIVDGTPLFIQGLTCGVGNITEPAIVAITGTGGTAPYTYSFDGGLNYTTTNTYTTYTAGTVFGKVQDANGCISAAINIVVFDLNPPTNLSFTQTPVTCSALTSDVTLVAINGVGTLTYAIIAPSSAAGNVPTGAGNDTFTGLAPDTYTFTVTDVNGCAYNESFTVDPVTNITVTGALANDVICNGQANGGLGFKIDNFALTYSYRINSGALVTGQNSGFVLSTGLPVGDQTIIVTDEVTDCTATYTITVSEPPVLLLVEIDNVNANCNFGAQVTVEATGGTPNYEYAFVQDGTAPLVSDYTSSASAVLDPATNIDWDVWVRDANGCAEQIDIAIDTDPLPTVAVSVLASNQCNLTGDPYTFTVTDTQGIAPFTYSIGSGFQSSTTFTVSKTGDYFVTVRDANGCETISATALTIYPVLDSSPAVTIFPSCADDDGEITMTGSGGSGNYSYSINSTASSITITGDVISGVPAGTYTVTIADTITSCSRDISITVGAPAPVSFTSTPTAVSCSGGNDGSITVNLLASNDNPIYTYSLDNGVTTQTSNVFSGLIAGTYNITVTSGRNCILTQSEIVLDPNAISIPTPTIVEYACTANTNTTTFSTITVNGVTGGSSNYTIYEFIKDGTIVQATDNNVYTEADFSGGVFTINVYDDNGCFEQTTATIQPFIGLDTLDVTVDNGITCINDEDITVSVTSTGGSPTNLEYTVEDVDGTIIGAVYSDTNPTGIFTSLPIGNYLITVVNLGSGCSLQTTHYVDEPNTFDLTIDNVVDVTCFSDSDGSVVVTFIDRVPTPTNDAGPFSYNIVDALGNPVRSGTAVNAAPITISSFASGTYTLTAGLTNSPFCTVSKNFTITAPTEALAITETHTEITCLSGNNDGSISASASGGWPGGYEFQLELTTGSVITAYSAVSDYSDLIAGDYILSVRDSAGCVVSTNVVLVNPAPINADVAPAPAFVACFGDTNSSITVSNIVGGQGSNYSFTLNMVSPMATSSGPQSSNTFEGLGAGTYNVLIQDGYSCEFTTAEVVIAQPSTIDALLVQSTFQTCLTGTSITLIATGGTGPYEYSDDDAFSNIIGGFATDVFIPVAPGTYQYYVRDANGCTSGISNEITIDPLPPLMVTIDATNAFISCTGDTTGVIVSEAQGGLGNYTYTLQDGSGTDITPAPIQSSPGVFTDLPAGTYQVLVSSGIDCEEVSTQVSITEPALALQTSYTTADVACSGGDDGRIEIIATGGTGVIKYAISPQLNQFFESPIFEDLGTGTYQVIVQDELGCFVLIDFTINEPMPVMLSIVPNSIVPEVCSGDLDGAFSIDLLGGTLPYSYSLDDIAAAYSTGDNTQTQFDFDNLSGGDHVVYIRDSSGCESEWNITLPESVLLDSQVSIEYGCTSNLSTNTVAVSIDSSITNMSDVDYSLNGGPFQSSNIFTDVPSGLDHRITVRHTNGCEKLSPDFDIDQIEPLGLLIEEGQLNQIVTSVSGGVAPYEYTVNGEVYGDEDKYFIYSSGDYTVAVTDANGCVSAITSYFEYIDVCIPNYFTPNGDGTLDGWGPGCTTQYKDLVVRVFDRYGREIVLLRVNEKWDGDYKGKALPSGDYWYIVKLNDSRNDREFVGHFTLYR